MKLNSTQFKAYVVSKAKQVMEEELKSSSAKGDRYFEMLKTGKFQDYDSPKGELSKFTKGEEDRKRLVSHLSKKDKQSYRDWLKTPEGKKSLINFSLNEEFDFLKNIQDKYARENTYQKRVIDHIKHIVEDISHISEKSFELIHTAWDDVNSIVKNNEEKITEKIKKYESAGKRKEYCGEVLYDLYFKNLKYDADKFYEELINRQDI